MFEKILPECGEDEEETEVAPLVEDALAHDADEEVVDNVRGEEEAVDGAAVLGAERQRRHRRLRRVQACKDLSKNHS